MTYVVTKDVLDFEPALKWHSSPKKKVSAIVVHYNSGIGTPGSDPYKLSTVSSILDIYHLSYHYLIGRDGELACLVPPKFKAWHAGVSSLHGEENVNEFSIGICLVGSNEIDFTTAAMDTFVALVRILRTVYAVPLNRIVGHNQVSPGRKIDPGKYWRWDVLDKIAVKGVE